jgi:8-oxo-dGTP diphosphatase
VKRLYPNQPVVGVGAVILDAGKILLEKRKNQPGKGKWTIPGGLVDLGEQLEHAVVREVEEETCMECVKNEIPRLIDVVDNIELDEKRKVKYHFVIIDYFVKVKSNVFKAASDAEELRWVSFDAVEGYDLTSSFRVFLRHNRQKLEQF